MPISKEDLHYNPETQEISVKRERFDRLMDFVRNLLDELEATQDAKAVADYHARRAKALGRICEVIVEDIEAGSKAISKWLEDHSIQELSKRSGVPYATCHRIINRQLATNSLSLSAFSKLLKAVEEEAFPLRLKATETLPNQKRS